MSTTGTTMVPANESQLAVTTDPSARAEKPTMTPPADVFESDSTFTILLDMPGVSHEGLDITLERNVLSILGQTNYPIPEGLSAAYVEFVPRNYKRSFALANDIDFDAIDATLKDGVLRLTLPKAQKAQKRQIAIRRE